MDLARAKSRPERSARRQPRGVTSTGMSMSSAPGPSAASCALRRSQGREDPGHAVGAGRDRLRRPGGGGRLRAGAPQLGVTSALPTAFR